MNYLRFFLLLVGICLAWSKGEAQITHTWTSTFSNVLYANTPNIATTLSEYKTLTSNDILHLGDIYENSWSPWDGSTYIANVSFGGVTIPRNAIITSAQLKSFSPNVGEEYLSIFIYPSGDLDFTQQMACDYGILPQMKDEDKDGIFFFDVTNIVSEIFNEEEYIQNVNRLSFLLQQDGGNEIIYLSNLSLEIKYTLPYIAFTYDDAGNRTKRELIVRRKKSMLQKTPLVLGKSNSFSKKTVEATENYKVNVYPNPTQGSLNVKVDNYPADLKGTILIYDISGKQLLNIPIQSTSKELDVSKFANGTYLMNIQIGTEITQWKIIKN